MIFDKIENHNNYRGLSEGLDKAFDYLLATDMENLALGKHVIQGDEIYVACMEYKTKILTLSKNEAHRQYIDVQYVVSGKEKMHVSGIEGLAVVEAYDADKDVIFYEKACECELAVKEGYFTVFFPEDAHMPGLNYADISTEVKKAVVKVHV